MRGMIRAFFAVSLGVLPLFSIARAGDGERDGGRVMVNPDSTGGTARRSTSWTFFGGLHRGVRVKREIECPRDYKGLVGISLNPSIGARWRVPIDVSVWKGWYEISPRVNVSIEYEVLDAGNIELFTAVGAGIFIRPDFPIAFDIGGGAEYRVSESIGLRMGARTLLYYNQKQRPSPALFSSPVIATIGMHLYPR